MRGIELWLVGLLSTLALVGCQSDEVHTRNATKPISPSVSRGATTEEAQSPTATAGRQARNTTSAEMPHETDGLPPGVPDTYHADMAELAADAGITDPPRIAPKRAVTPQEIDQIMADCMTDHGFPAVVKDGGGWGYEVPAGQSDAAALVSYSCKALYPMAAEFVTPLSADQLRVYYDWLVEETIPCMQSLGYPTPEPPTFETYAANYEASQALFFADAALDPAEVGGAMPDILSNCQALPPDDLLYGG